jgi:hypothetical protein
MTSATFHHLRRAGLCALLVLPACGAAASGPSLVSVSGRQLIVQKRNPDGSLQPPVPYVMRGVVWSPAGENTQSDNEARRAEFANWVAADAPALAAMGVNTVRVYLDPGFSAQALAVLDTLYSNGIMVVMTVDDAVNDVSRATQAVGFYKNHPAVLMWLLGNEWNINLYYGKPECNTVLKAAQCTQTAAAAIKALDPNHPVATSYGDIDIAAPGLRLADTANYVNNVAPGVDVWGLNIFRGATFGSLFEQWLSIASKPMFLAEMGTDALRWPALLVDETMQAHFDLCLWAHMLPQLSGVHPALPSIGGAFFEWNDEWWKIVPAGTQQTGGYPVAGGHPDDYANEEYFGLTSVSRQPRQAVSLLATAFQPGYVRPPLGRILGVVSRGTSAPEYPGQNGVARFYDCGRPFYQMNGGGGGGRGFNVVALDPASGTPVRPATNYDTWLTRSACAANDPGAAMFGLVAYLNAVPAGSLVLLAVADDAGLNQDNSCAPFAASSCFQAGLAALQALGSQQIGNYCFRNSWALVAVKGQGQHIAEGLAAGSPVSLYSGLPLGRAKGDFNRDDRPDLLVRYDDPATPPGADEWKHDAWLMQGPTRIGSAVEISPRPAPSWELSGVDDFNSDSKNDLVLWNASTGTVEFWLMDGTTRTGAPVPLGGGPGYASPWKLSATADFNHDYHPDLVWRNFSTQQIEIWTMNGTTRIGTLIPVPSAAVDANWEIVAALDYGNDVAGAGGGRDGNTDFLWYNSSSGKIVLWYMNSVVQRFSGHFTLPAQAGANNWKVLAGGDYGIGPDGPDAAPPVAQANDIVWRNATSGKYVVWLMDFAGNRTGGVFTAPDGPSPNPTYWTIVGPR